MRNKKIRQLVYMALLCALLLLMAFTPIGYLKVGLIEITFNVIPVVIGAIVISPLAGAVLGGIFGLTSFAQCFGASYFGAALLGINPIFAFITCLVPRILIGLTAGWTYRGLDRHKAPVGVATGVASLVGALTNTVFFIGTLLLLFGQTDFIRGFGDTVFAIIVTLVGLNGAVEAVVCTLVGAAVSTAVLLMIEKGHNIADW